MRVLLLFFVFIFHFTFAQLQGTVVAVADGDTFTMLTANKQQVKVRLHGIDCPEKKQDFGMVAKQFLSDQIYQKQVSVRKLDTDRYGRIVGIAIVSGVNVNEELLKAGLAWHYKQYDKNIAWDELEMQAKKSKKGLWAKSDAVAPWEYRTQQRTLPVN